MTIVCIILTLFGALGNAIMMVRSEFAWTNIIAMSMCTMATGFIIGAASETRRR